jgi:hypothetical protein
MKVAKIRIGGRMFILDPEQDLDGLRRDIVAAASSGADFVHFVTAGNVAVSALVTPYLPVRISEIETTPEQAAATGPTAQIVDDPPFSVGAHFDG